ncbi:MAG: hypothetical protein H5T42_00450 [Methanothrix sp.]|jgi:hypothetical protein|uniref:Uncharacterized protein n=1 Tax=Methanothrix thermoacetophila (strain DSM 6194 / JCM 14653 / NBRC 101360 / PT) TaxID=349307 RepID=A0B8C0_METTP|nr:MULTISPECIES: hypothetical protein [Methanothrix]ABK14944.1 hypothetical protein Mthe_1162 [Methanothrix thermoacetophila PT]MBC7078942.1 hypothetical protein [Methanothrix sp.]NPU87103.1 hypothetical protein [Methanothrix sp.]
MIRMSIRMLIPLLTIALVAGVVAAQTSNEAFVPVSGQQVGGEFGRAWLQNFLRYNEPPVETDQVNDLWSWGGAPKGKRIVGGKLVPDMTVNYTNITSDWLGEMPLGTIVNLNGSRYATLKEGLPLSPLYLSDDPWVRAQQLGTIVRTPTDYYYPLI